LLLLILSFLIWAWSTTFHPAQEQSESVSCSSNDRRVSHGQRVKVLTWNIQFLAGKGYYFFYEGGNDTCPQQSDIQRTLSGIVSVISEEDPDIILLQEVDDGAKRTGYTNQLDELLDLLPQEYRCHVSSFYWKADYVPHSQIMGAVGMKLSVLSKYTIEKAIRHQLALLPQNPLSQLFYLKRCLLEVHLQDSQGNACVILNTHLSAFAQKTETLKKQVKEISTVLNRLNKENIPWILGGDFNLQPYQKEIRPLLQRYTSVPSSSEVLNNQKQQWYTHFPNDPLIDHPNATLDYLFSSHHWHLGEHEVRQDITLSLSDHLPVIATFSYSR
jgi:endonuclease/exonuclease/phosphatase family metal-dependent hydrolase